MPVTGVATHTAPSHTQTVVVLMVGVPSMYSTRQTQAAELVSTTRVQGVVHRRDSAGKAGENTLISKGAWLPRRQQPTKNSNVQCRTIGLSLGVYHSQLARAYSSSCPSQKATSHGLAMAFTVPLLALVAEHSEIARSHPIIAQDDFSRSFIASGITACWRRAVGPPWGSCRVTILTKRLHLAGLLGAWLKGTLSSVLCARVKIWGRFHLCQHLFVPCDTTTYLPHGLVISVYASPHRL